jgi:hypothetical protein
MTQDHRSSRAEFPLANAQRLHAEGQSLHAIADAIGWSFAHTRRKLAASAQDPTHNGHLPAIPAAPSSAIPSQPIALVLPPLASELDDLKARVATLEAFMAAMQAQQRTIAIASQPIAIHRSEAIHWVSRGLHVADDMLAAVDAYAREHRLDKREVVDLALRTFFAQVDAEVAHD